jgi:hypothetical protein
MTEEKFITYHGRVQQVDSVNNGVWVVPESGGGALFIPLQNTAAFQFMPEVGDRLMYVRYKDYIPVPIRFLGQADPKLRGGNFPLAPGEFQLQSSGGSYVYLNDLGDVSIVDGSMLGSIKISNANRQIILQHITTTIQTFNGISVTVDQDQQSISLNNSVQNLSVTMDQNGITIKNGATGGFVSINSNGTTIQDSKAIYLQAPQVYIGPNATTNGSTFGLAVNSGPTGDYPFDFMTGIPIPGSSSVRIAP